MTTLGETTATARTATVSDHADEVPVRFFLFLLAVLVAGVVLCVRGLRDKTPRRRLTREERLYADLQFLQDQQNAIEEDRRRTDRLRNY